MTMITLERENRRKKENEEAECKGRKRRGKAEKLSRIIFK